MIRRYGLTACVVIVLLSQLTAYRAQNQEISSSLPLKGAFQNVHDPVLIRQDDSYYIFHTGLGVPVKRSVDLHHWRIARGTPVFRRIPKEAAAHVPGATEIWAPDISYYNGRYHLYYSVSTFGSNRSAIGLATNLTLHPAADDFEWTDQGVVISSDFSDEFNAIDPNLVLDQDEEPWLAFGSFWSGIKMIKLDGETGKQSQRDTTLYSLAARADHPRAIEAPFIIRHRDFFYLFVSFDQCCAGIDSTYHVRVGRADAVTGPYVDRAGVSMLEGGGTQITFFNERFRGPGHNAVFYEDDQHYIVYHAYDTVYVGTPTLQIQRLSWNDDGWPYIAEFWDRG